MGRHKTTSDTTDENIMGNKIDIILEDKQNEGPIITNQRIEIAKMLSTKCCEIDGDLCHRYGCQCLLLCDLYSCPYWKFKEKIKPVTPGGAHKVTEHCSTMQEEVNSEWTELWNKALTLTREFVPTRKITDREKKTAIQEAKQWAKDKLKPVMRKQPLSTYALQTYSRIRVGDTNYFEDLSLMSITEIKDKAASMGFKMHEIREWLKQYE